MKQHSSIHPPRVRGSRPDAETSERIFLIKAVSALRATHQVRLLAFKAAESRKILVLKVPAFCRFDDSLTHLIQSVPHVIEREELM